MNYSQNIIRSNRSGRYISSKKKKNSCSARRPPRIHYNKKNRTKPTKVGLIFENGFFFFFLFPLSIRKSHLTSSSIFRRTKRRALFKNGDCNVVLANVSKLRRRYLQDLFTTLVDARWRWTLLVFCASFLLSWLGFAAVWYLIAYTHGDLLPENADDPQWSPCVINMRTFVASFLFSVETQHTTGYGYRMVTEQCYEAITLFCFQSIAGLMIQVRASPSTFRHLKFLSHVFHPY